MIEEKLTTEAWNLYEIGKQYNTQENLYEEGTENYNYYHGRQWEGLQRPKSSQEPIVLNVIRPIIKYKVNIVNSNSYEIVFNPNSYNSVKELQKLKIVTKGLNEFTGKMWEKSQAGKVVKSIVKTAAINSEGIMHLFFDEEKKLIKVEEIDKNNIYYGNENNQNIQEQPYILVTHRLPVQTVKDMAREYKDNGYNHLSEEDINTDIVSDKETFEQQGREHMLMEVDPACLIIEKFERREDGKIWVSTSTRTCQIMKPRSTNCENYPFAHFIWDSEKGYARGSSEVRSLLENQREINKTATRRAIAIKLGAYPKLVVDSDKIKNPRALNQVGAVVELENLRASDIPAVIDYLRPQPLSPDALNLQQDLLQTTRELAGASDIATGTIDPSQASGKAILAVQQAAQTPLNEQVDSFKYFMEDIGTIIFEFIKVYFSDGLTLYKKERSFDELGQMLETDKPFKLSKKELEKLDLDIKIDITPAGVYDKYAQNVFLENCLMKGLLSLEEFVKTIPDDSFTPKTSLQVMLEERKEIQREIAKIQQQVNAMDSAVRQAITMEGGDVDALSEPQPQPGDEGYQSIQ